MKNYLLATLMLFSIALNAQEKTFTHKVSNNESIVRNNIPVVIDLHKIKGVKFNVKSAIVTLDGMEVPCQLDDMNGDLINDELVFLTDLEANSTKTYSISIKANGTQKNYTPKVWGALIFNDRKGNYPHLKNLEANGKSYLFNDVFMHGAVMESELVGWRLYFDQRQNLDLYGKKYKRLEIEKTQFYTSVEQLNEGYGVDVLWAGGAIGCGTFRGWNNGPTLLDSVETRGQRMICEGPIRTIVEMKDWGWKIKGSEEKGINMTQRYIQYAGHRDIEVSIDFDAPLGDELFCVGVQKVGVTATDSVRRDNIPQGFINKDIALSGNSKIGIAASWGCDYPDMGKKQMWPPQPIGLAVSIPQEYIKETHEDDLNYLFIIGNKGGTHFEYRTAFCAGLEEEGWNAEKWFDSVKKPGVLY